MTAGAKQEILPLLTPIKCINFIRVQLWARQHPLVFLPLLVFEGRSVAAPCCFSNFNYFPISNLFSLQIGVVPKVPRRSEGSHKIITDIHPGGSLFFFIIIIILEAVLGHDTFFSSVSCGLLRDPPLGGGVALLSWATGGGSCFIAVEDDPPPAHRGRCPFYSPMTHVILCDLPRPSVQAVGEKKILTSTLYDPSGAPLKHPSSPQLCYMLPVTLKLP